MHHVDLHLNVVPIIKAPVGWPVTVVAVVAMVALAGLDLLGAVAAKEWALSGRGWRW